MADPVALYRQVRAALLGLEALQGNLHEVQVTRDLPTDSSGFIRPYVLLSGGLGDFLEGERSLTSEVATKAMFWDFQTTCVGASPEHAIACAALVRGLFTNLRIGTGRVRKNPDGFETTAPIPDNTETPVRYMIPLQWRVPTN